MSRLRSVVYELDAFDQSWIVGCSCTGPSSRIRMSASIGRVILTRIIHEGRREAFETETRSGFWQVRAVKTYLPSAEKAEQEKPYRARGSDDGVGFYE